MKCLSSDETGPYTALGFRLSMGCMAVAKVVISMSLNAVALA